MRVVAVILVLILAGAACATPGSAPSPRTATPGPTSPSTAPGPTIDGQPVINAAEILFQAEGRIGRPAHEDARCFFSLLSASAELAPIVRCGPEQGRVRAWLGAWHTHALDAAMTPHGARLELGADLLPGWELLPGEQLWRPDGALPADEDDTGFMPVVTAFDRTAVRTTHPIVTGFATDFQTCMAERGLLAFGLRFLYDGAPYVTAEAAIAAVEHVGHDIIDYGFHAGRDDAVAQRECLDESARRWDVDLVGAA